MTTLFNRFKIQSTQNLTQDLSKSIKGLLLILKFPTQVIFPGSVSARLE